MTSNETQAIAELLVGVLVILVIFWLIRDGVRSAIRKERGAPGLLPPAQPPPLSAFPVVSNDGPGRFCVKGVDKESGMDVTDHIDAASPVNARVKAELRGMVVTSIDRD